MKIHLATDHAGLELKNSIKDYLIKNSHDVEDHGAHEYDAQDDYPDFIFPWNSSKKYHRNTLKNNKISKLLQK